MTDLVHITAMANLPAQVIIDACDFYGMPAFNVVENPLWVDPLDEDTGELDELDELALVDEVGEPEFIEEEWSFEDRKEFVLKLIQNLLVDFMTPVIALDTSAEVEAVENASAQVEAKMAGQNLYLKNFVSVVGEDISTD